MRAALARRESVVKSTPTREAKLPRLETSKPDGPPESSGVGSKRKVADLTTPSCLTDEPAKRPAPPKVQVGTVAVKDRFDLGYHALEKANLSPRPRRPGRAKVA